MTVPLHTLRRIAVGSTNAVKVRAVEAVLGPLTSSTIIQGVQVSSNVPDQPWGDEETIRGARTRALSARQALDADLGIGIEGGVVDTASGLRTCAWAVIVDREGRMGTGGSLAMPLPRVVEGAVRAGAELGHAMDALTGLNDTKHAQGAVGILTNGLVDRQRAYEMLVTYALAPFLTPAYWEESP